LSFVQVLRSAKPTIDYEPTEHELSSMGEQAVAMRQSLLATSHMPGKRQNVKKVFRPLLATHVFE
jgi:hypothetical protein